MNLPSEFSGCQPLMLIGASCATVSEAIDHPRLHIEDDVVQVEGGWPKATTQALQHAGYAVNPWADRNLYFGGVAAVEQRPDGELGAAGDRRRGGHGIVVP